MEGIELDDYVSCAVCGEHLKMINTHHLSKHNITFDDYKQMFPNEPTISKQLSKQKGDRQLGELNPNFKKFDIVESTELNGDIVNTLDNGKQFIQEGKYRRYGNIKICPICNNEYFAHNNKVKAGRGKFCSKECYNKSLIGNITHKQELNGQIIYSLDDGRKFKITIAYKNTPNEREIRKYGTIKTCVECGNLFFISNTDKKRQVGKCCSNECSAVMRSKLYSGENSWMWKGGISFEKYPVEFNGYLKRKIRERDNHTCQICGTHVDELSQMLAVHHIDYNKYNCDESNLVSLCGSCHGLTNINRDKWIKYFRSND